MGKYEFSPECRKLLEDSVVPYAIYQLIDGRVVTLVLSEGFCRLFNYDDKEKAYYDMDHNMYDQADPEDVSRLTEAATRFAKGEGRYDIVYRTKRSDGGSYIIVHATGEHFVTDTGVRLAQVWYTQEGAYSFDFDHLTGLPTMTCFYELAQVGCKDILSEGGIPAFIFLDLSGMKTFNHKNGFSEGDKLLRAFSTLLVRFFGNKNCSRFAQDHFAIYTRGDEVDDKLNMLFREWQAIFENMALPIRAGVYVSNSENIDVTASCDNAKIACDMLRNTYVSGINYYNKQLQDDMEKQEYIISNIDRAIEEKWITVYYQPIVRAVSGRVCDEEALARWIDPEKGFMSPGDFIPILEDAHLIYKLDLYIVDVILEKLKKISKEGLHLVPQSVNLSRTDFECCDIVSEICKKVDKAGISHSLLTIEITESIMASNFDYMKNQVERFRKLGFQVWMDDFGSGYSSLDVLQDLEFDLIKFDMRFLHQLDKGPKGKIILTELMRMATTLGLETVCEGVETVEHVNFLKEIGCCKLQGYYYAKPMPLEQILERYKTGKQIGFEDPRESDYYDTLGRINLYDLDWVSNSASDDLDRFFNTIPMVIMELTDSAVRIVRCNQSYREFSDRTFERNVGEEFEDFMTIPEHHRGNFLGPMVECAKNGYKVLTDERFPDNTTVHTIMKRIAVNPYRKTSSVAVAILAITDDSRGATYAAIAKALAADYFNLFYINIATEDFVEYASEVGDEELAVKNRGTDFFSEARKQALKHLYKSDRANFVSMFTKENVMKALDEEGTFSLTYRLLKKGKPVYVNMKVMRMSENDDFLIAAVSNVNNQMKQREIIERVRREQVTNARICALSGNYICMYTVNLSDNSYVGYNADFEYESLGLPLEGDDFFKDAMEEGRRTICKDDHKTVYKEFSKEKILNAIKETGMFIMRYRLMINDEPHKVLMRANVVTENDGDKLIVGISQDTVHVIDGTS